MKKLWKVNVSTGNRNRYLYSFGRDTFAAGTEIFNFNTFPHYLKMHRLQTSSDEQNEKLKKVIFSASRETNSAFDFYRLAVIFQQPHKESHIYCGLHRVNPRQYTSSSVDKRMPQRAEPPIDEMIYMRARAQETRVSSLPRESRIVNRAEKKSTARGINEEPSQRAATRCRSVFLPARKLQPCGKLAPLKNKR